MHFTDSEIRQWSRTGPGGDRERVIAHLAACPECADAYAEAIRSASMAVDRVSADAPGDVADFVKVGYDVPDKARAVVPFPASRRRAWIGLAAAAALIAAVAVPYLLQVRERRDDTTVRGGGLQALSPTGTAEQGAQFEWTTTGAASTYRVDIGDATGIVYSETTSDTRTHLRDDAWRKLTAGVDYWWTVTALDRSGRELASTGRQAFRIRSR